MAAVVARSMVLTTASTMGIIMAVAAVLEIHMERKAVVTMKENMTRAGRVPIRSSRESEIRRWRPEFSTAMAIIRPPMNRKLMDFM